MIPDASLSLASSPEHLAVIAALVGGFAELLGLDPLATDDLATAVMEASKNVVVHAYDGSEGPLDVELCALPEAIHAVVRDHGIGIRPRLGERSQPHTGIGMPLIHARARRVIYTNLDGGGTEVAIELDTPGSSPPLEPVEEGASSPQAAEVPEGAAEVRLTCGGRRTFACLLPRHLRALATLAGFSGGAVAACGVLASTLAEGGGRSAAAARLSIWGDPVPGRLELRVGPLRAGTGQLLVSQVGDGRRVWGAAVDVAAVSRPAADGTSELVEISIRARA